MPTRSLPNAILPTMRLLTLPRKPPPKEIRSRATRMPSQPGACFLSSTARNVTEDRLKAPGGGLAFAYRKFRPPSQGRSFGFSATALSGGACLTGQNYLSRSVGHSCVSSSLSERSPAALQRMHISLGVGLTIPTLGRLIGQVVDRKPSKIAALSVW